LRKRLLIWFFCYTFY